VVAVAAAIVQMLV